MNIFTPDQLTLTGINALLAWSVYIVMLSGTISFAQVSFAAIGAYVSGVMTVRHGLPLAAALPAGMFAAALMAVITGYPALRVRGLFLMLVTIGLVVVVRVLLQNFAYFGGVQGLTGMDGVAPMHVLAAVLVVFVLVFVLSRSPLQRTLDAVRHDERVAASLGINATYLRMMAFLFGAAVAGLAGALYAHYVVYINPERFDILWSVYIVFYVILGGVNNIWGPAVGAVVLTLLPEVFQAFSAWRPTVYGLAIVVMLAVRPDGLLSFRTPTIRASRLPRQG